MMDIPEEIRQLFTLFYPGSRDEFATREQWIADVVESFRGERRQVIKSFLDDLLNGGCSDAEIAQVWRSVSPSYDFSNGGHRAFLTEVRNMIQ
jgi:hypothetical protein